MLRSVLIVLGLIVGLLVINWLFWHILGLIAIVLGILFWLAVVSVVAYFIYSALRGKTTEPKAAIGGYKVWDTHNQGVLVFKSEPTINDLAPSPSISALETPTDQSFRIANNSKVKILEDNGGEAIKVKILADGVLEKVGWVARSAVIRELKNESK